MNKLKYKEIGLNARQTERLDKLHEHLFKLEESKLLRKIDSKRILKRKYLNMKTISARIPLEILNKLQDLCNKKNISISEFVKNLIIKELEGGVK